MLFRLTLVLAILLSVIPGAMAGKIGKDKRLPIAAYAKQHKLDVADARKQFGASGRIMCPFNAASAFVVFRNDIVMTARHVAFGDASFNSYAGPGRPRHCSFEVSEDGITSTWHEVAIETLIAPEEKQRSFADRFDWVIMKLEKPIPGVAPYALPGERLTAGDAILVTVRQEGFPHEDWNERIVEDCAVRKLVDIDGIADSGLKTDCSATNGASGGALLKQGANGLEVIGVMSSVTNSCKKFNSKSCYSFAVGLSEDIRKAIRALAGEQ